MDTASQRLAECNLPVLGRSSNQILDHPLYRRLSMTNAPLSNPETRLFSDNILSKAQDHVASVRLQQMRLRDALYELDKELVSAIDVLTRCRAVLSPSRRLPLEILSEVFSWVEPQEEADTRLDAALSISHVCSSWRTTALSTPCLWADILITETTHPSLVNHALAVSSKHPLDIVFQLEDVLDLDSEFPSKPGIVSLVEAADRWLKVSLVCESSALAVIGPLFADIKGRINRLETLRITFTDRDVLAFDIQGTSVFEFAPLLTHLTIENAAPQLSMCIPLDNITHVCEIRHMNWEPGRYTPLEMYLQCPHLLHLEVVQPAVRIQWTDILPTLSHPTLRYLCISEHECIQAVKALPSLEELHVKSPLVEGLIGSIPPIPATFIPCITELITRSKCTLQHLTLMDLADPANGGRNIWDLFVLTPKLTHLNLTYHHWTADRLYDKDLCGLLVHLCAREVAPDLQSLAIEIFPSNVNVYAQTVDFLHTLGALMSNGQQIAIRIVFYFDANLIPGVFAIMKRLRAIKLSLALNVSVTSLCSPPPLTSNGQLNAGFTVNRERPGERIYV